MSGSHYARAAHIIDISSSCDCCKDRQSYSLYLVATIAFHYISCASIIIHTYNNANMVSYGPAVLRVNDNNVTDLESIGTAC